MGWYDKGLHINPGLVALTGGVGRGMAAFGDSLVGLGNQKVARAEKDALDKKKAAKERLAARGLNIKNRLLNPDATNTLAKTYNIDKNSPLYKQGAPSQFNADLGLVDLGKADKKKAPTLTFSYIGNDKYKYGRMSDGSTVKSKFPVKQKPIQTKKPIVLSSYIGNDKYKYTTMSDGSTVKSKFPVKESATKTTALTTMAKLIKEQNKYPVGSNIYNLYQQRISNLAKGSGNALNDALAKLMGINAGGKQPSTQNNTPTKKDPLGIR